MLATLNAMLGKLSRRQILAGGLVVAALGIAAGFWLSNAAPGGASACPARKQAAALIDEAAGGELAALQATGLGRGYADLAFEDDTGRPTTLGDFAGRPLLVNFWATWCIPCREEMPALNALAARYDTETFQIVPINLDTGGEAIEKARKFLDEENLPNLPLYADPSFEAFKRLQTEAVAIGLPATLLLDEEGCELAVLQGPAEWDSTDGQKVVDALIAASAL